MNVQFPSNWILAARDALARLADRPLALFVLLFALNAIARPYSGITHDSRLYSGQVLNQVEGGAYADDLFFRYGSQDQYSLFSRLAAPIVQAIGLPAGFFVIYLISKALLIWSMMRLVRTLIPDGVAAVLALAFCMTVTVGYGGLATLNVHESFLTPRMLSIALVLFALDFLLRERPWLSLIFLVIALAIHPLMAFGGFLVWTAFLIWQRLGGRVLAGLTVFASIGALVVIAYEPLAIRVFGQMDDDWRLTIMHASSFNFPSLWSNGDWWFLASQLVLGGIVAWKLRGIDPAKAKFTVVVLLVTFIAATGAILAEQLPYALLLQGQPYRSMWILGFLHIAFAFWLFVDWSQSESRAVQLCGAGMLVFLSWNDPVTLQILLPLFVFPVCVLALRGLEKEPRDPAWLPHSVQLSVFVGAIFWMGYKYLILSSSFEALKVLHPELRDLVDVYVKNLGPTVPLLALAWILVRFQFDQNRRAQWLTAAVALVIQISFFVFPETDYYRDHCTKYRGDLHEVRLAIAAERGMAQPLPTVYSNLGCLDYIWLDLHAKSYFDWWQAGNFMFRREMAMEGQRRACLVAAFEVEKYRRYKHELPQGDKEVVSRFFKTEFDSIQLDQAVLARLCQEPGLDYIVTDHHFDGLRPSQHGALYLYRCRQVRAALGLPESQGTRTLAATR